LKLGGGGLLREFAVTVGVFDGVHGGHKAILDLLLSEARRHGLGSAAVTFDPHPDQVVRSRKVSLLTPIDERLELLRSYGLDEIKVLRFDEELRETPHEAFVREILVDELGCRFLAVGPEFALGRGRAGTAEALRDLGARLGFGFRQVDPVMIGDRRVSSTWIKEALQAGEIELASRLLGRHYKLKGAVVTGAGRGRTIGYPTANIALPSNKLVPGPGTYAGAVSVGGAIRPSAVNVGFRPTFRDSPSRGLTIEAHILDFERDVVGEPIELLMIARLRDERHFGDKEALAEQIALDVRDVRRMVGPEYLTEGSGPWRSR
jgi:riboflavin kinase/FMN adenylyltransferase